MNHFSLILIDRMTAVADGGGGQLKNFLLKSQYKLKLMYTVGKPWYFL